MVKRKREISDDDVAKIHEEYLRIGKNILKVLKKLEYSVHTFHSVENLIYCREAVGLFKKYLACNPSENIQVLIVCSYMFAHKLHNDNSDYLDYPFFKNMFGFRKLKLDYNQIFNMELEMCSLSKYVSTDRTSALG